MRKPGRFVLHWKGTPWVGASLVLLIAFAALFFFTGNPPSDNKTIQQRYEADISFGPQNAAVVLLEYGDFQCEPCARFSSALATLRAKYKDQVRFIFRFYPLEKHKYALISAQVAFAAYLQDKFWEMNDLLFERQKEWANAADPYPYFDAYAAQLDLDIARFHDDFNAQKTKDLIISQRDEAEQVGIERTPAFFLNGSAIVPNSPEELAPYLEALL